MRERGRPRRAAREPVWIDESDALAIHDRVIALHGGLPAVRDSGLLESALARPRQHYTYKKRTSLPDLAAIYAAGIVRNHLCVDGNKRTGFVIGVLFLELNGFEFLAREEDAAQAVMELGAGSIGEADFARWLKTNIKRI
jgi:death on curing protein